jgi:hypothetical protein
MPGDEPQWGDGTFEFGRWETPFENADVELMEVVRGYGPLTRKDDEAAWERRSLLKSPCEATLVVLVRIHQTNGGQPGYFDDPLYRVSFQDASAFRVLDEGGLSEFWYQTKKLGGRPGQTTFRVRNHEWFTESLLPWIHGTEEGWSYVIATSDDCIEVVAAAPPVITLEA